MAISARSNSALSRFWCVVLAAIAYLLTGLEFAAAPAQKSSAPPDMLLSCVKELSKPNMLSRRLGELAAQLIAESRAMIHVTVAKGWSGVTPAIVVSASLLISSATLNTTTSIERS